MCVTKVPLKDMPSHAGDFEVMVHHMSLLARANQRLTVEKQKLTRQNLELNAKVLEQGQLINKLAEKQRITTVDFQTLRHHLRIAPVQIVMPDFEQHKKLRQC